MVPGSCSKEVLNLTNNSNVGSAGKWLFRIDAAQIEVPKVCDALQTPANGSCNVTGQTVGSVARCQCFEDFQMQFDVEEFGSTTTTTNAIATEITLTCMAQSTMDNSTNDKFANSTMGPKATATEKGWYKQ